MRVYFELATVILILLFVSNFTRNKLFMMIASFISMGFMAFITGTRFSLGGYDYQNYAFFYDNVIAIHKLDLGEFFSTEKIIGYDRGWYILNSIVKASGLNFFALTMTVSFLFMIVVWWVIRKYLENEMLIPVTFLGFYFLDVGFVYMRQSIAIAIFALSIRFLIGNKRNAFMYFGLITIAATVHFSAFVLYPLWFFTKVTWTKRGARDTVLIGSLLFILPVLGVKFDNVISRFGGLIGGNGGSKITEVGVRYAAGMVNPMHLIIFLLLSFFAIRAINDKENNEVQNGFMWIFMMLLPIYTIFAGTEIIIRNQFYFYLAIPVVLDFALRRFKEGSKVVLTSGYLILCLALMFKFAISFDDGELTAYINFIQNDMNIFDDYRLY